MTDRCTAAAQLGHAVRLGYLREVDKQLALALCRLAGESAEEIMWLCALTSRRVADGHVCLRLSAIPELPPMPDERGSDLLAGLRAFAPPILARRLVETALCGGPGDGRPLVLERQRLYLRRYHEHEAAVGAHVERRMAAASAPEPWMEEAVLRLFPVTQSPQAASQLSLGLAPRRDEDKQRHAAEVALLRGLTVVSGGPGTGKTTTVVKMLALLVEQARHLGHAPPRILLLAPTGKAAARLSEAIAGQRDRIDAPAEVRDAIPVQAATIHRALGFRLGSVSQRRAERLLDADIVLVDEASMVDLSLMRRLLDAVPHKAKLILLGDRDQLSSVEAGAVLGDLCGAGLHVGVRASSELQACIVQLERSYRYRADSGIGRLATAIRKGQSKQVLELLTGSRYDDVRLRAPLPSHGLGCAEQDIIAGYTAYLRAPSPEAALAMFSGLRVLCAHRHGDAGVVSLNRHIEAALERCGLLQPRGSHYPGRPMMVTRNDPSTQLYNGDIALIWPEASAGGQATQDMAAAAVRLRAVVADGQGGLRSFSPSRLPHHETVFAMTVHKSQGTEFEHVLIVLPAEESPLVCRELLYTAVTRARTRVTIHGRPETVRAAVDRLNVRASGLRERLWGE